LSFQPLIFNFQFNKVFVIIGIMLTGMLTGYLLRKKRLHWIHKVITVLIWLLLFLLGIDAGSNEAIIKGLHSIGIEATLITIGAVIGSILFAWALWHFIYKRHKKAVRE
jgi:LPXTG-motif cell wall-anchored protein